jgi:formylglycine-generating enzyme required for sulfatase activity
MLDLGGGVKMELVYIKPGVFTMGGTDAPQDGWQADERPEHKVTVTRGFYLGKFKVTRGQFAAFVKAASYKTEAEREGKATGRRASGAWEDIAGASWQNPVVFTQTDEHPVINVSWNDVRAFCEWAAKKTGRGVRLPTEAEWEYSCRAGTKTRWLFGDNDAALGEYAWTNNNSGVETHPVGQKKPNAWGLYDIQGNAWEWCQDWVGPYAGDAVDPAGPASGENRCLRGGSWFDDAPHCRVAIRASFPPSNRISFLGFRVALP